MPERSSLEPAHRISGLSPEIGIGFAAWSWSIADIALQSLLYVGTAEVPFTSVDLVNLTPRSEYANEK